MTTLVSLYCDLALGHSRDLDGANELQTRRLQKRIVELAEEVESHLSKENLNHE